MQIQASSQKEMQALSKLVNETQMQMQEGKVDMGITLDAGLFVISGTKSYKQDTSSRSENNTTHAVDVDITPVNDQESSAEVDRNTAPESTNMSNKGGEIDQNAKKYNVSTLLDPLTQPNITGSSRNSQEESYGSNDMAHNHYLEEARKKSQKRNKNSKPSVMHTTSLQDTTNGSKQKPRSNNQTSKSLPVSKSSGVTSNSVPLIELYNKIPERGEFRTKAGILIPMHLEESLESTQERIAYSWGAKEASKRRKSMLDYRIQQLSKGSSEGSGIIPEIQSMVDVPIHQEDPAVQRTLLIDTVISMLTEKTASTPTPLNTQAQVQMCPMLLLAVQHKLFQLDGSDIVDLIVALRMTLKTVHDELHHRILDFRLGYNEEMSRRKWTATEKKRLELMVKLIDKKMRERRIIRNLERLVGARELEMDYKLMTQTD
ncbi:hypothetical protein Tco_0319022 [Tanacetum coccineum]